MFLRDFLGNIKDVYEYSYQDFSLNKRIWNENCEKESKGTNIEY